MANYCISKYREHAYFTRTITTLILAQVCGIALFGGALMPLALAASTNKTMTLSRQRKIESCYAAIPF